MRISTVALVMLLVAGFVQLDCTQPAGAPAAPREDSTPHAGGATTDPCKNPDPNASKSDMMRLWLTITTKSPSPGDLTPEHWPALCPSAVSSVASLVSNADTKKVVASYLGWHRIVKNLAILNGQYDANTANRIWILAVSRQDKFTTPEQGLQPDIIEMFQHMQGSPPLPPNAARNITRVNSYVSGNRIGFGQSFTQVRHNSVVSAQQANIPGWSGGVGHPSGTEVATLFP